MREDFVFFDFFILFKFFFLRCLEECFFNLFVCFYVFCFRKKKKCKKIQKKKKIQSQSINVLSWIHAKTFNEAWCCNRWRRRRLWSSLPTTRPEFIIITILVIRHTEQEDEVHQRHLARRHRRWRRVPRSESQTGCVHLSARTTDSDRKRHQQ